MNANITAAVVLLTAASFAFLTGCSQAPAFPNAETSSTTAATPETSTGGISGRIHGGQQPITNAKVYLLAAGNTGYRTAATSLLTAASYPQYPTQKDGNGDWYVTTDSNGFFQIADSCTQNQQVYIASVGGNPGFGANTAANEIAILGVCPSAGNFDSALTGVFISEISTVAAAYAAAAYTTDVFDIGAPPGAVAQTGIQNAFSNAANLFDVQNINDLARTTTEGGRGNVPQAKIHTLANILASCVNSIGPGSPSCTTLFLYAKTNGTTGTTPGDVTTAAINIAHNPSSTGLATLYTLQNQNSPFGPALASAPSDFAIAVDYPNAAPGNGASLAVDGIGNVWSLAPGISTLAKISPTGSIPVPPYAIGNGFSGARGLAIDTSNNVWVLGDGTGVQNFLGINLTFPTPTFAELSNLGVFVNSLTETPNLGSHPPSSATNLVMDANGAFYYSSARNIFGFTSATCCTEKYDPSTLTFTDLDNGDATPGTNFVAINTASAWATGNGNSLSQSTGSSKLNILNGGLSTATGVALDSAGRAWVADKGNNSVSLFNSAGSPVSTSGYTGNLSAPEAIAVDGSGNAWVTNSSGSLNLAEFTGAGSPVGNGFSSSGLPSAGSVVIDQSGNIWVASSTSQTITQFLGLAAPVVAPMSAAIGAGTLGKRPQ